MAESETKRERTIPIQVLVPPSLADRAAKLAHTLCVSRSAWIRLLLEQACDELEEPLPEPTSAVEWVEREGL